MNRALKNLALLPLLTTLTCLYAAGQGQVCTTPVISWEGSYTLSASATNVTSPGGWTVTMNETTSSSDLSLPLAGVACNQAGWQGPLSDPSAAGSYSSKGTLSCAPASGKQTENWSASGSPVPASAAGVVINFSNNTYYFWPAMVVNGTETTTNCSGNTSSGPAPFPLYPIELLSGTAGVLPLPAQPGPLNGNVTFQGTDFSFGEQVPFTLTFALTPKVDCDPCKKNGGQGMPLASSVSTESGSLGEDLAVAGTEFSLHYESRRSPGAAGSAAAIADASMIGGWTLNVHHTHDSGSNTLLLGNGTQRNGYELGNLLLVNNQALFTSEDSSEVYVFSLTTGKHVQTLRPMTGALLYQFGYDAAGNLITITDASGNVTTIQRDASEHPTAIVAPFGQITTLAVDANGFLSQITDPLGKSVVLVNSATGLLTSRTDANGNVFNYTYDANGRLSKDADPLGGFVSLTRTNAASGFGWTVGETTSMGRTSSYQTTMTLPWVLSSTSTVNEQHTNTWPNGLQATSGTTLQNGQIKKNIRLPDGTATSDTLGPDPRFGLQTPVPVSGTINLGNLAMTMTGSRTATLGTAGQPFTLTTQTDTQTINGRTYKSVFTTSNKTFIDTSPAKRVATRVLDSLERPISVQVGALLPVTFAYDNHGRVSALTQGTRVSKLAYDANGFLVSTTDPLSLTTSLTHDADGRLLTITLPDGRVITYSYDANDNVTSITPPGKSAHDFSYNAVDLLTTYTPPIVSRTGSTTYSYDADRDPTTVTRPDGQTINNGYDVAGRLSSRTIPSETINYSYDASTGNLSSESISGGESLAYGYNGPLPISSALRGTVAGTVSQVFNNNFWVASQSLNNRNNVNFSYDNDGLLTKAGTETVKRDPKDGFVTGTTLGIVSDTFKYTTFGELVGYTAKFVVGGVTTTLDTVAYTRDADGRISTITETIGGAKTIFSYTYDEAGHLTTVKKNGATASTYTYDTNSNRLTVTTSAGAVAGTYDAQDRLLTYGNASYTYTANGELASQTVGSQTTSYTYDVLGNLTTVTLPNGNKITYLIDPRNHRVGKVINGALQTGFLYDGARIVAQLNASNQIVSQFVYGTSSTTPDYMVSGGAIYRIITDQLGSPRLIVNTTTGTIAERIDYDEFGKVLKDTNPGFQPFSFAGGLYDQDTMLARLGARDYSATLGRWTAKDPISFDGGDTNLYGYVLDDPVNLTDPTGLQCGVCTKKDKLKDYPSTRLKPGDPIPGKHYTPSTPEGEVVMPNGTIRYWNRGKYAAFSKPHDLDSTECSESYRRVPAAYCTNILGTCELSYPEKWVRKDGKMSYPAEGRGVGEPVPLRP